jgi:hypothetical protein
MTNSILEKIKDLEQELFLLSKKNQLLEEKLTQDVNLNIKQFISKDAKNEYGEKIHMLELQVKKLLEDKKHTLILINKLEEKKSVEKKEVHKDYTNFLFPEFKNDIKENIVSLKKENIVNLKKENQDINEKIKNIFTNTKIPR